MSIKKHVGKIKSSDQRCVVVFMQLPEDPQACLIVNTEALTPRFEQMLMEVVESPEGQQEKDLANTMNRRMVPETGRTVLAEFHARGLLRSEPVDNIIMMPRPNTPFALRAILEQMGALAAKDQATDQASSDVKYNPVTANLEAGKNEEAVNMGRNLLMEAEMLQAEADKKREQAYRYAPSLRPQNTSKVFTAEVDQVDIDTIKRQLDRTTETPTKSGRGRRSSAAKAANGK